MNVKLIENHENIVKTKNYNAFTAFLTVSENLKENNEKLIKSASHPRYKTVKDVKNVAPKVSFDQGREAHRDRKLYFCPSKHKELF